MIFLIQKKSNLCDFIIKSLNNVPFKFIEISSNRSSRSQSRDLRGSESSIDLLGHLSSCSTLKRECQRLFTAILAEFEFPLSFFRRPARVSTANARQIRPTLFSTAAAALLNETISRYRDRRLIGQKYIWKIYSPRFRSVTCCFTRNKIIMNTMELKQKDLVLQIS